MVRLGIVAQVPTGGCQGGAATKCWFSQVMQQRQDQASAGDVVAAGPKVVVRTQSLDIEAEGSVGSPANRLDVELVGRDEGQPVVRRVRLSFGGPPP